VRRATNVSETAERAAVDTDASLPLAQRLMAAKSMTRKDADAELVSALDALAGDPEPPLAEHGAAALKSGSEVRSGH
jgi:hypothetical protein